MYWFWVQFQINNTRAVSPFHSFVTTRVSMTILGASTREFDRSFDVQNVLLMYPQWSLIITCMHTLMYAQLYCLSIDVHQAPTRIHHQVHHRHA